MYIFFFFFRKTGKKGEMIVKKKQKKKIISTRVNNATINPLARNNLYARISSFQTRACLEFAFFSPETVSRRLPHTRRPCGFCTFPMTQSAFIGIGKITFLFFSYNPILCPCA